MAVDLAIPLTSSMPLEHNDNGDDEVLESLIWYSDGSMCADETNGRKLTHKAEEVKLVPSTPHVSRTLAADCTKHHQSHRRPRVGFFDDGATTTADEQPTTVVEYLRVNIGGNSVQFNQATLHERNEESYLAKFAKLPHDRRLQVADGYLEQEKEYFIERSPVLFEYIIDYYNTVLVVDRKKLTMVQKISTAPYLSQLVEESEFHGLLLGGVRAKLWELMENPRSSVYAKAFAFLSVLFVVISVTGLICGSVPALQGPDREPLQGLQYVENLCMIWFTIEFVARFVVSPKKFEFLKVALNIIDVCTIVPFYFEIATQYIDVSASNLKNLQGTMVVIRVFRVTRVARVFKFARYSLGLRAFGDTMRNSMKELGMLSMFLFTGIILFSTTLYFLEKDEPGSKFTSIPQACWWCVITMTTVGYGDMTPVTTGGQCVAAVTSVCGIVVLAFPISMIIDKFAESTDQQDKKKMLLVPTPGGRVDNRKSRRRRRGLF